MNLTSPSDVRAILDGLAVRPSRKLGQNFLVDRNILDILLREAGVGPRDGVVEVGPGLGVVTRELLASAGRVLAVEKDRRLAAHLADALRGVGAACLDLRCMDALDLDCDDLPAQGYTRVVSNLPYSVGSRVLMNLADASVPPERVVVTVQKEVADRLVAAAGTADYGLLTVRMRRAFDTRIVHVVSPGCFWPPPVVRSAIVRMDRRAEAVSGPAAERCLFMRLTRDAFSRRRKQLASLLPDILPEGGKSVAGWRGELAGMGLPERCRPENLELAHWLALCRVAVREAARV